MNSLISRTICLTALVLALSAAFPTTDSVVPEQELSQSGGPFSGTDYDSIYDDQDNDELKSDQKKDDIDDGPISQEASDLGGKETSKDAIAIHAEVVKSQTEDAAEDAKWEAEAKIKPTQEETLRSMIDAFGKNETDPMTGKTYFAELEALEAKKAALEAVIEAKKLKEEAKEEAETKVAEVKYDHMLHDAFSHSEHDEHIAHMAAMKDATKVAEEDHHHDHDAATTVHTAAPLIPATPATGKSLDCDEMTGDVLHNC